MDASETESVKPFKRLPGTCGWLRLGNDEGLQ